MISKVNEAVELRKKLKKKELINKRSTAKTISQMNLPVKDWKEMEKEIEKGV